MAIRGPAGITISNTGIFILCLCGLFLFVYTFRGSLTSETGPIYGSKYDRSYRISEVLSAAIYLSEKAGHKVKAIREQDDLDEQSKGETKEGVNDPITNGDLESHRILVKGFKKGFPALHIVSEEHEEESTEGIIPPSMKHPEVLSLGGDDPKFPAEDITVWIDPLDATKEYTEKLTEYVTVMACIAVNGIPVAGVIRKPFDDKTYWGWVGHGTSSNMAGVTPGKDEGGPLRVIVSRSHAGSVKETAQAAFDGREVTVTPAGGAGYKAIEVVENKQDVYVHTTIIKKWDICAGDAIFRTLGGRQTDLRGNDINYSHNLDPKNEHGLIATMHDHDAYREKLQGVSNS